MSANEPLVPKRSPVVYSVSHLRLFLWTAKKKTLVHLAAKMCQVIGKERRGRWKKKESHCWFLMNSCRFCCCTKKGNKLSIFMFRWFIMYINFERYVINLFTASAYDEFRFIFFFILSLSFSMLNLSSLSLDNMGCTFEGRKTWCIDIQCFCSWRECSGRVAGRGFISCWVSLRFQECNVPSCYQV